MLKIVCSNPRAQVVCSNRVLKSCGNRVWPQDWVPLVHREVIQLPAAAKHREWSRQREAKMAGVDLSKPTCIRGMGENGKAIDKAFADSIHSLVERSGETGCAWIWSRVGVVSAHTTTLIMG